MITTELLNNAPYW